YLQKYPGAAERLERRGGQPTDMPNLPFSQGEVDKLVAFMKYTAAMNTEGWPPEVRVGDMNRRLTLAGRSVAQAQTVTAAHDAVAPAAGAEATAVAPVERGKGLVAEPGCIACHTSDSKRTVGPGWGGLFGRQVTLADGSSRVADRDYLV